MDRKEYVAKLEAILSDRTKFSKSEKDRDRTEAVEGQLTAVLKVLHKEGHLSDKEYERLRPVGTAIPRMYGLPKIHKHGLPLRPIMDMRNSPYHTIAKWLVEKLKPLQSHLYPLSLKDSFEFVDAIKNINVAGRRMLSLDVASLFTNVPVAETINYLCDVIRDTNYPVGMPLERLKELLTRCTQNVQFLCNGQLYRQIDGVAMGSPLGPFLANVFMGKVEMTSLQDTINDLNFYGRYVDDIFCLTDVTTDTDALVQKFNNAHPSLTFSAEFEADNEIAFLDVLLHRQEDGSIQRRVFRKKTWTGQYINFHSFVPLNIKRNLVQGLAARVRRICSPETVDAELQQLRNILHENGYPERFILRNKGERTAKPTMATAEKKDLFIRLPFQGDAAADLVRRRLKAAITSAFSAANLRVCFTNSPLLRLGGKDRLPLQATSMCIYSFTCSCGAGYVGRTTRRLEKRVREHIPAWLGRGEKKSISSSILAHLVDTNHRVDAKEAFHVVYRTPASFSRGLRQRVLATAEAVAIRLANPVLCCQKTLTQALCLPWPTPTQPPDSSGACTTYPTYKHYSQPMSPSPSPPRPNDHDAPTTP
ncbi:hypothetical protein SprV_0200902000 [Sparganum proliferum]